MQIGATLLMSLGLYVMVTGEFATPHSKMGLLTATLVYLQVLSGLLRGSKGSKTEWGDHYNMSKRRKIFEFYHKNMGWVILGVSFITMTLGFAQIEQWIYLVTLILLWLIYGYVIVDSILNKRHIETWRAIWGEKND
jgi:cell division protein FtsW (lipid II flippase)